MSFSGEQMKSLRSCASWRDLDLCKYQKIGVLKKTSYDRDYAAYELFQSLHSKEWRKGRRFFVRYSFLYLEQLTELIQQRILCLPNHNQFEKEWRLLSLYAILDHVSALLHAERMELAPILSIYQIKEDCLKFLSIENVLDFVWSQNHQSDWSNQDQTKQIHEQWKSKKNPIINQWMKALEIEKIPVSYRQFCHAKKELWGVFEDEVEDLVNQWIQEECNWFESFLED